MPTGDRGNQKNIVTTKFDIYYNNTLLVYLRHEFQTNRPLVPMLLRGNPYVGSGSKLRYAFPRRSAGTRACRAREREQVKPSLAKPLYDVPLDSKKSLFC